MFWYKSVYSLFYLMIRFFKTLLYLPETKVKLNEISKKNVNFFWVKQIKLQRALKLSSGIL